MELTIQQIEQLLIPVDSKTVSHLGHDNDSKTLYVKFATGGLYRYSDISHTEYMSIKDDQSIGSKLRRVTKDKEYKKL
jgi:hypothetical protein